MRVDLDEIKLIGSTQWEIRYVNDVCNRVWYGGSLPEAHTRGIDRFNRLDLCVRKAPPHAASVILDKVGLWLASSRRKLELNDLLRVLGTDYKVVPAIDATNRPVFRLAWDKDPEPDDEMLVHIMPEFNKALDRR